jgi:hypothetical protein
LFQLPLTSDKSRRVGNRITVRKGIDYHFGTEEWNSSANKATTRKIHALFRILFSFAVVNARRGEQQVMETHPRRILRRT